MEPQSLPIFECVVFEYNHDYASGEETDKPQWESIHTRYVQARNEHRAETVFRQTLKDEQVYMPSIPDQLVEVNVCTYYAVLSNLDKERNPLVVDTDDSQEKFSLIGDPIKNVFQDAKQSVQAQLERIQTSRIIGICFLDSDGRLVQLIEEDPALKEAIVEHYEDRLRQMNNFEKELTTVKEPAIASALFGNSVAH